MVRVYRSTDVGARVLTGQPGSLINVLDVLVDGQGGQPGAGWTKPYSGADKAVFKPAGDNGYYWFDDSAARVGNTTYKVANVVAYETMTGLDAGVGRFPSTGYMYQAKMTPSYTLSAPIGWVLIADEWGFYLYVNTYYSDIATGNTGYRAFSYIGKFNGHNVADAWCYGIAPQAIESSYNNSAITVADDSGVSVSSGFLARSYNGVTQAVKIAHHKLGTPSRIGYGAVSMASSSDWCLSEPVGIFDSANPSVIRCYAPGLYASLAKSSDHAAHGATLLTIDGPSGPGTLMGFLTIPDGNNNMLFVDTVDWGR